MTTVISLFSRPALGVTSQFDSAKGFCPATSSHSLNVYIRRCGMFDSQLYRKLSLAATVLGLFTVTGCSNQPRMIASSSSANAAGLSGNVTQPLQLITLPKGTTITATVGQTLASDKNHWGDSFVASITRPVKIDGKTVLPRGTEVTGRVLEVKNHELKVALSSVVVHGIYCDLATNSRRPSDKDQPNHKGKKNSTRKQKKDNSTLSARTRLTFKLSKPATIPAKA